MNKGGAGKNCYSEVAKIQLHRRVTAELYAEQGSEKDSEKDSEKERFGPVFVIELLLEGKTQN